MLFSYLRKVRRLLAARPSSTQQVAVLVAALAVSGCLALNDHAPEADSGVSSARGDMGQGGRGGSPAGSGGIEGGNTADAAPDVPEGAATDTGATTCGVGTHLCSGQCVPDNSVATCGSACEPCPQVSGGEAACDGKSCSVVCPPGTKVCKNACVPMGEACGGACAAGSHDCGGLCVSDTAVSSCGTACTACSPAPAGGVATCDGTKCDFRCETGKRCSDKCGECCVDADCAPQAGRAASCEPGTLKCRYQCPSGTVECDGQCIAAGGCCRDSDCPMQAGKVGSCIRTSGMCEYSCAPGQKACSGGRCIPGGGCCGDGDCSGNFACINGGCSQSSCKSGFKVCDGRCIASSGCCGDGECSGNFACSNNTCSRTTCRNGFKRCGNACIANAACCSADGCCGNADCGQGMECRNRKCVAAPKPNDASCTSHSECASGYCGVRVGGDYPRVCANCGGAGQQCCPTGTRCPGGMTCYQDHPGMPDIPSLIFYTECVPCGGTGQKPCCTGSQCANGIDTCHTCTF